MTQQERRTIRILGANAVNELRSLACVFCMVTLPLMTFLNRPNGLRMPNAAGTA